MAAGNGIGTSLTGGGIRRGYFDRMAELSRPLLGGNTWGRDDVKLSLSSCAQVGIPYGTYLRTGSLNIRYILDEYSRETIHEEIRGAGVVVTLIKGEMGVIKRPTILIGLTKDFGGKEEKYGAKIYQLSYRELEDAYKDFERFVNLVEEAHPQGRRLTFEDF